MSPSGLRRPNDPPLLILISLADGPKHGHALAKDIEDFAGVRLGPGALYGAITRLAERGLIEPFGSDDDRRRPYPRAWRERYGGELAALIQDNLDEGRPAWRLWLSAIGGGLRERFRQARHATA